MNGLAQIGQVAERTGLSVRTIRYYEEVGLAVPSERSSGGFRLYSESDIARLELIRQMKPLDLSLAEMAEIITSMEQPGISGAELEHHRALIVERCATLRRQLKAADALVEAITAAIGQQPNRQPVKLH